MAGHYKESLIRVFIRPPSKPPTSPNTAHTPFAKSARASSPLRAHRDVPLEELPRCSVGERPRSPMAATRAGSGRRKTPSPMAATRAGSGGEKRHPPIAATSAGSGGEITPSPMAATRAGSGGEITPSPMAATSAGLGKGKSRSINRGAWVSNLGFLQISPIRPLLDSRFSNRVLRLILECVNRPPGDGPFTEIRFEQARAQVS